VIAWAARDGVDRPGSREVKAEGRRAERWRDAEARTHPRTHAGLEMRADAQIG
jgi:hypothetical protein